VVKVYVRVDARHEPDEVVEVVEVDALEQRSVCVLLAEVHFERSSGHRHRHSKIAMADDVEDFLLQVYVRVE
jgi:hypothetical protein